MLGGERFGPDLERMVDFAEGQIKALCNWCSLIPSGCKNKNGYWKRSTRGAREEGRGETDIIISIGSAISVGCEFYNEAVASIEGIECKCNRRSF